MTGGAVSVEIDESRRLIRTTVIGPLTDAVLGECSRRIRATPEFQKGYAALLDLSRITEAKVSSQVVIGFAQGAQADTNRFAILARNITAFGMARMYEMIADVSETRVRVFTDEGLAMEWLTE